MIRLSWVKSEIEKSLRGEASAKTCTILQRF